MLNMLSSAIIIGDSEDHKKPVQVATFLQAVCTSCNSYKIGCTSCNLYRISLSSNPNLYNTVVKVGLKKKFS